MHPQMEEIYNTYYKQVVKLCCSILHNPANAEDVAQEIFIQIDKHLDDFRHDCAFSSWVHRIAVNQCLMLFRKNSYKREYTILDAWKCPNNSNKDNSFKHQNYPRSMASPSDYNPLLPPDTEAIRSFDLRLDLIKALDMMPAGMGRILKLHDIDGYEHWEVGFIIGRTAGTSKSQLHKAREKMQKLLSRRTDDPPRPKFTRKRKKKNED